MVVFQSKLLVYQRVIGIELGFAKQRKKQQCQLKMEETDFWNRWLVGKSNQIAAMLTKIEKSPSKKKNVNHRESPFLALIILGTFKVSKAHPFYH